MTSEVHRSIALAYRLTAVALLPPSKSKPILEKGEISSKLIGTFYKLGGDEHPKILEALKQGVTFSSEIDSCMKSDVCWNEFSTDITGVIVSSPKKLRCPPYESVYVIQGGPPVFEAPSVLSSLKRYYSLLGLEADKEIVIAADHASVELEFLAALHDAEASVYEGLIEEVNPFDIAEIRRGFLGDHVLKWIPSFTKCIKENASTNIVKMIADTVERLLNIEKYL